MKDTTAGGSGGGADGDGGAGGLTQEQLVTLARESEWVLQTPLDTSTHEGIWLEAACLATLAERERLSRLE